MNLVSLSTMTRRPLGSGRPLRYSVVPTLVAITGLAVMLPWLVHVRSVPAFVLLLTLLAQCLHGAARSVMSRHQLLTTVFWTFSLAYLAVPATYQVSTLQAAWGDEFIYDDQPRLIFTLVMLNLAFLSFAVGAAGRPADPATTSPPTKKATWFGPKSVSGVVVRTTVGAKNRIATGLRMPMIYCGLALLLLPLVITRGGGVAALFSSRSDYSDALSSAGVSQAESGGVTVALVRILPGALALAATFAMVLVWRNRNIRAVVPLAIAALLLVLYANPLTNTRYVSSTAFLCLALLLLRPQSRRSLAVISAVLVIGVIGIYPLANAFRGTSDSGQPASLADNDFDGFQQLVNTRQYVEEHGHTWGRQFGSAALYALPRRFWPDKAVPASIPVAENRGYTFTNLSLPLPGEIYLEFGLPGVSLIMFGWGRLWRRLDRAWLAGTRTRSGALVPYLTMAQLGLLRGPVGSLVPIYGTTVLLLLFAVAPEHGTGVQTSSSAGGLGRQVPRGFNTRRLS